MNKGLVADDLEDAMRMAVEGDTVNEFCDTLRLTARTKGSEPEREEGFIAIEDIRRDLISSSKIDAMRAKIAAELSGNEIYSELGIVGTQTVIPLSELHKVTMAYQKRALIRLCNLFGVKFS